VVKRERRVDVLGRDRRRAVEEGVDQREADAVRFDARGELAGEPGLRLGEVLVGAVPEGPRMVGDAESAGVAGGGDGECQLAGQTLDVADREPSETREIEAVASPSRG
jgi:hypothetical protein